MMSMLIAFKSCKIVYMIFFKPSRKYGHVTLWRSINLLTSARNVIYCYT